VFIWTSPLFVRGLAVDREEKSNKADARRRMKLRSIKGFISAIKMPLTMA